MVKTCVRKIRRLLLRNTHVKFKWRHKTTLLSCFTSNKDQTPLMNRFNVGYKVKCPGCGIDYIGKTDGTLYEQTEEHAWTITSSPVCNHLKTCQNFID